MAGSELPSSLGPTQPRTAADLAPEGPVARLAARVTGWSERWIPDAFVFALVATILVIAAAIAQRKVAPLAIVDLWGAGFWDLIPFTLQMALVIITGYVVATSRPVFRLIVWLASIPKRPRTAIAFVALFAMLSAWLNWGFSLIFSAMLAREIARRVEGVDYRAVAASAFLGLGSIWAQGLSGSAALQMATPSALPAAIRGVVAAGGLVPEGVISLRHTIFLWQSLLSVVLEIAVVVVVVYLAAPNAAHARTAAAMGVDLGPSPLDREPPATRGTPGERLEHAPWLSALVVALAGLYLWRTLTGSGDLLSALNLNVVNLFFLTVGIALHGTPARLMRAFREATPGVWGVILQFPFYAGIAAVITKTHLNETIASWFVHASNAHTFPALIAIYSALLGVFVPSGGSKWVIEAPYVMQAAHALHAHLGWMVTVYDLGEALANLVQPFWMLPILGLFRLRARDVMGHTFVVFLVLTPLVLLLVTLLAPTLAYPL
jgi:short-chain fatty acids transporter